MDLLTRARLLKHIVRWRLTWDHHDLDYRPAGVSAKFLTAREVAALVPDAAVCASSGMAGNGRCSIFYWALKDRYRRTQHPRGLTWIANGAQGGRGRAPGTAEELGEPGLVARYITGHTETLKSLLKLADQGKLSFHVLPQGQFAELIDGQARGVDHVVSTVGVGTFLDPRVGTGTAVAGGGGEPLVAVQGDALRYHLPRITRGFVTGAYADAEGNVYQTHATTLTEIREIVRAARANGGKAFVAVADVIPKDEARIHLRADEIDGVVVHAWNEQTGGVRMREWWPMFTTESDLTAVEGVTRMKFINHVLGITPRRSAVDDALARLAARTFTGLTGPGAYVNIGVGLPEEVCRWVFRAGLTEDVTFLTETGVIGGIPSPGVYFGSAANPKRLVSSVEVFRFCRAHLDATILGVLQADSRGNVNVSNRGPGARNYVGPGGLPDLVHSARKVLFVGTWMAHADLGIEDGTLRIRKAGKPKFVDRVDEVTFSGDQALAAGKQVWYATNVGVFRLTDRGMELAQVMPGIDVRRDILSGPMKVVVPEGTVPVVPRDVLTGHGYRLAWSGKVDAEPYEG